MKLRQSRRVINIQEPNLPEIGVVPVVGSDVFELRFAKVRFLVFFPVSGDDFIITHNLCYEPVQNEPDLVNLVPSSSGHFFFLGFGDMLVRWWWFRCTFGCSGGSSSNGEVVGS